MILPKKLYHYSKDPIHELDLNFYKNSEKFQNFFPKPIGFWVSVEDFEDDQTWKSGCEAENFQLEGLDYKYLINLKDGAKIINLQTSYEIIDFGIKYRKNKPTENAGAYDYIYEIKWSEVMKIADGIIIAPYDWSLRLKLITTWYYGWDCASGCIWNLDAIDTLTLEAREEISLPNH